MLPAMLLIPMLAVTVVVLPQEYEASVAVEPDSVVVEVRMSPSLAGSGARLMLRGQQVVQWRSDVRRVDTTAGLVEIDGVSPLRYVVRGATARVPLPVPIAPMRQDRRTAHIAVTGLAAGAQVRRGFPRLEWTGDSAVADVRDVPSFVRLPRTTGWGVGQWSEAFVVLLVAVASYAWYRRGVSA